jgi:outer membrane receptor protein involved in Fe transport
LRDHLPRPGNFDTNLPRPFRTQFGSPWDHGLVEPYNSLTDLINDNPNRIQLLFGGGKSLRTRYTAFYFQDDWRLARNFQINLGIRYEYSPPLVGGYNINSSNPFGPFIGSNTQPMFKADRNDWGPHVAMIWNPGGDQTVVRAGGSFGYIMPQAIFYYDMAFIDPSLPFVAKHSPWISHCTRRSLSLKETSLRSARKPLLAESHYAW